MRRWSLNGRAIINLGPGSSVSMCKCRKKFCKWVNRFQSPERLIWLWQDSRTGENEKHQEVRTRCRMVTCEAVDGQEADLP